MQFERQVKKWGETSLIVTIPADLARYLELKAEDEVIIQDDEGKHGKFIAMWKKGDEK